MNDFVEQGSVVNQPSNWALGIRWVLAHVLLLGSVFLLAFWLYTTTFYGVGILLAVPLIIVALAMAQWIGVRGLFQERKDRRWWLFAFLIGFSLVILLLGYLPWTPTKGLSLSPVGAAIWGAVLGLIQGIVLLRRYPRGLWCAPANGVGLAGGLLIMQGLLASIQSVCPKSPLDIFGVSRDCMFPVIVLLPLAGTLFFTIVTGATLVWIANREGSTPVALSRKHIASAAGLLLLVGIPFLAISVLPMRATEQAARHKADTKLSDVSMISPDEGWIAGTDYESHRPVMLHYMAGAWNEVAIPDSQGITNLQSISMTSADDGWAVGGPSALLHYANGAWRKAALPVGISSNAAILSVDMISRSSGWAIAYDYNAASDDMTLLHYNNPGYTLLHHNGAQWEYVQIPPAVTVTDASFSSDNNGWVIGTRDDHGIMLHYINGTWQEFDGQTNVIPQVVQTLSPDDGWGMSIDNYQNATNMFHYVGDKWSVSDTLPGVSLTDLAMISPHEGWATGSANENSPARVAIAHYDGIRWTRMPIDTSFPAIEGVSMVSADEGWAVGAESTILHYKNGAWTRYP